jgi:hypothetical protein
MVKHSTRADNFVIHGDDPARALVQFQFSKDGGIGFGRRAKAGARRAERCLRPVLE